MKLHEGRCSGQPCSRTHAYRCRNSHNWFKNDNVDLEFTITAHPYYPYCSYACARGARLADPGYFMYRRTLDTIMDDDTYATKYPDASVHDDFNSLMNQTKEL